MPIFKARPASPSSSRTATTDAMGRGRARLPTLCLQATALGLKYAFINQPVEVQALRRQFASYLGIGERRPDLVVRFGAGPELPKSLRRPAEQVIG